MTDIAHIVSRYGIAGYPGQLSGNTYAFPVPEGDLVSVIENLKGIHGLPLKTVAATDERETHGTFRIYYVFGIPKEGIFLVPYLNVDKYTQVFPSLTPLYHEFSAYEKEIKSFFGLLPAGHPDAKRVILHSETFPKNLYPLLKDFAWDSKTTLSEEEREWPEFQTYAGEGVYEIPVGPVHAGIIEPGHFRFSMLGEEMLRLEPRLGYVHKGTEKLFEHLPMEDKLKLSERISGDSSFHHALAWSQAVETLAGVTVSEKARILRVVYAELERLANHFNDLAFIMLDTGFSFGGSHGTRIRERILQWNEKLSGSRFLRGVVMPGGVTKDISTETIDELQNDLDVIEKDFSEVIEVAEETVSVLNRLKTTGILDRDVAEDHGALGVAARAVGLGLDARADYPYAEYQNIQFSVPTEETGDVYARYRIRVREAHQSFRILHQALTMALHAEGPLALELPSLPADSQAVGIVEGFRGDIVYFVKTDQQGKITRVKVRDTSFINWTVFPYIVSRDVIPDFPLINKSFNLSYTGNDL
ncbi:MAG: hypothetical protein A2808_03025 [Candidatus Moranbacteria bacterium RIFCSPHIGHO2_01_FULL_55_24]|nr:MAG: hypothetical protein A2808_03025 [Candidatus Moranbacteria bacterium RIFCSPHIGHO2_01_FULL_55_24]